MNRNLKAVETADHPQAENVFAARPEVLPPPPSVVDASHRVWDRLRRFDISAEQTDAGRLISLGRGDPGHVSFDILRTRMLQAFAERGWRRVAVTSPTQGCGKTFLSANLALSLARHQGHRTLLVDADLRLPQIAEVMGIANPGRLDRFLAGEVGVADHALRLAGTRLAVMPNAGRVADPAETLHQAETGRALDRMEAELAPQTVIYDTPPMLACDDLMELLPRVDCVLLVVGGGITQAREVQQCSAILEGRTPILGIVLNRAEDPQMDRYTSP